MELKVNIYIYFGNYQKYFVTNDPDRLTRCDDLGCHLPPPPQPSSHPISTCPLHSHLQSDLHTKTMYLISVEDENTFPALVTANIRKSIKKCLEERPEHLSTLKRRLVEVTGTGYHQLFINPVGQSYFFIFTSDYHKPLHAWAIRRQQDGSLRTDCIQAITDWIIDIEDIKKLGLPRRLEFDLADVYERTLVLKQEKYTTQCNIS